MLPKVMKKVMMILKQVGLSSVYDKNTNVLYCFGTLVCCWSKVAGDDEALILSFDLRTPPEISALVAASLVKNDIPICVNKSVFFDPVDFVLTDQRAEEAYTNFMRQQIENIDSYLKEEKPKYLM